MVKTSKESIRKNLDLLLEGKDSKATIEEMNEREVNIPSPKKPITKQESKWRSDKATLENPKVRAGLVKLENGLYDTNPDETDCGILRVSTENYKRWTEEENKIEESKVKKVLSRKHPSKKLITRQQAQSKAFELAGLKQPEEIFKPQGQVKFYIAEQPIFYDVNNLWWIWKHDEYRWEISNEIDILNKVEEITGEDIITPKNRTLILNSLKQECRKSIPKEIKPTWVQFQEKFFDIETGESFDSTPDYFSANPIFWKVGKTEDTPKIDELFKSWVDEKDVIKLYEICAFIIVPKYFIHSFHFLYSPPGYGKSTFLNLLIKFVGEHNTVSTTLDRINNNTRFETKNWYKKLLISMSEVNNVFDLKKSSVINSATGEDLLEAEIKGGENFRYRNYGKFVYPTNKLVKVDAEDGFGRRVRKVDFIHQYQKEKDVLVDIPDYEFENLAKKCLRIAKGLWKKRRFSGDVDITKRMEQYQQASKTLIERFIDENYEVESDDERITFDNFYVELSKHYKKINKKLPSKIEVGKEIRKLGYRTGKSSWKNEFLNDDNQLKYITKHTIFGLKRMEVKD